MGLWGEQDASEISDNPFFVDEGIYLSNLTQFEMREKKTGGHQVLMQWVIEDEDSEYEGQNVSDWINVYITSEARQEADPKQLRMDQSRLRNRLNGIGMSDDEQNSIVDENGEWDEDLAGNYIGTMRLVEVKVRDGKGDNEGKKFSNIFALHNLDEG